MFHEEELLPYVREPDYDQKHQVNVLAVYCSKMEETIRTAPSGKHAQKIAEERCVAFEGECASAILRSAAKRHVQMLLNNYWNID
ncbi:MAG TPA: hypothetical protein VMU30_11715 [Bacteroidota bacterium]|nr:hypothetical protein [Bacteroidota bacterium]